MEGLVTLLSWELLFFVVINAFWICLYFSYKHRAPVSVNKENPFVSVIIPVFNKGSYIKKTIESVLNLNYKNKEVIIVNDGSTDNSLDICKQYQRKGLIKLISFKKNCGKSYALNRGIKEAKHDLILTVDADSFIDNNALSHMITHFKNKKIGAVAGVVRAKWGKGLLNKFQIIEYFQQSFQRFIQGFFNAVLVLPGPVSLYSKKAIEDSGYFEDDTMVEDWDITMKMHKKGYNIISDKRAFSDTEAPKTVRSWWRQRTRWSRGGIKIAFKHMDIGKKAKNKALTRLMFPLHVMWLFIPFVIVPTMILLMIPSSLAMGELMVAISMFFATLQNIFVAGISGIAQLYTVADRIVLNFFDFKNFDIVRGLAYMSGLAFIAFTYTAVKTIDRRFKPKHFITVILMPIYWLMLNIVFIYSAIIEATKSKMKW